MDTPDDILEHYGIKGMKWGVRRNTKELQRARGKKQWEPKVSADAAKAKRSMEKAKKGGGPDALSNDELKELNKRLNLEQNYERLVNDKKTASGGQFVKDFLVNVGKQQAQNWVNRKLQDLLKGK